MVYYIIGVIMMTLVFIYYLFNNPEENNSKAINILPGPILNNFNKLRMIIQYYFLLTVPEFAYNWLSKYGRIVRVYMLGNTILTSDRYLMNDILNGPLSKNFTSRMASDQGLYKLGMFKNGIIWNNDKLSWKKNRKAFENNFSHKHLKDAVDITREAINNEIKRIKNIYEFPLVKDGMLNQQIDLLNFLRKVTLSVILKLCFDISITDNESNSLIKAIVDYFKAWEFFLLKPNLIAYIFYPITTIKHLKSVKRLNEEISRLITNYIKDYEVTSFLTTLKENNSSKEEIQQNILEMILAGTDTSSVSLYYTILLLTENKQKYDKLIESVKTDPNSSYIDLVLKESMRLLPVGPVIIRQAIHDCFLNESNIKVKKGDNFVLHLARMNRDREYFENPLCFKPERFNDKSVFFFPMGKGPKSCVGQYLAMIEMRVILSELIKNFHIVRQANSQSINMKTKWDIAQQPIIEEKVALLPLKDCLLVGAHSVGKTTLAKYIETKLNCDISSELARVIIREMNINAEKIQTDKTICFNLQKEIIKRLALIEKDGKFDNKLVIHDRSAIDALVYAKYFLTKSQYDELACMNETKYLIEQYKAKSITFLIQPYEKYLKNDNFRIMPTNLDEWIEFSRLFEQVMLDLDISYYIIDKVELNDRFIQVMEKLSF